MPKDLNVKYLGSLRSEQPADSSVHPSTQLSRRGFLQVASVAAVGAGFSNCLLANELGNGIELVHSVNRLALKLDGQERFVIDRRLFSGHPRLSVKTSDTHYEIKFESARFPGFCCHADLSLEIWKGVFGWSYRLFLKQFDLLFRGSLQKWLSGEELSQAKLTRSLRIAGGDQWRVDIRSSGVATFSPGWMLDFQGRRLFSAYLDAQELYGNNLHLSLPSPTHPSLIAKTFRRRTIAVMERGDSDWGIFPYFATTKDLQLLPSGSSFDKLVLEVCESRSGYQRAAFLATGNDGRVAASANPVPDFEVGNAEKFNLPLSRMIYAAFLPNGARYLTAQLSTAKWFDVGSFSFGLRDSALAPVLEAYKNSDDPTADVTLAPSVELTANMPGAYVATTQVPKAAGIPLTFGRFLCKTGYFLHLDCEQHKIYSSAEGLRVQLLRPRDLLQVELQFFGMRLEHCWGKSYLKPSGDDRNAKIVARFPAQTIAEQSPYLGDPSCNPTSTSVELPDPPVKARLGHTSRLVFRPFTHLGASKELKFELSDLVDWSKWELVVGKFAAPPLTDDGKVDLTKAQPTLVNPSEPSTLETAIELPYRVIISPDDRARFVTGVEPAEGPASKRVCLWHAALKTNKQEGQTRPAGPVVRVIWTREEGPDFCPQQVLEGKAVCAVPLNQTDRKALLRAFTNYSTTTYSEKPYIPPAMPVRAMALSTLGGWIDGSVEWDPAKSESLQSWRYRAAAAQDDIVQLSYGGYLMPTGHAAVLIRIAQREWVQRGHQRIGYLIKRCYIQVIEREKYFPSLGQLNVGRDLPFKKIVITRDTTPFLDAPQCLSPDPPFWPKVCGQVFRFPLELTDHDGNLTTGTLAMKFVSKKVAYPTDDAGRATLANEISAYMAEVEPGIGSTQPVGLRGSATGSQKIAYVPSVHLGDTSFTTTKLIWAVTKPDDNSDLVRRRIGQPPWYPALDEAHIHLDPAQNFGPNSFVTNVKYASPYVTSGFPNEGSDQNKGEVFLIAPSSPKFGFPGEHSAGLALPSTQVGAVSRRFGIIGGNPADAVLNTSVGQFDPKSFFKDARATLLGAIDLADAVAPIVGMVDQQSKVPRLIQHEIRDIRKQYDTFRAQIEEIPKSLTEIQAVLQKYNDLATQAAKELQGHLVTSGIGQIRNLISYQDVPIQLQISAEEVRAKMLDIRANFNERLHQLSDDTNISLLREYIIFKITEKVSCTEAELAALRRSFQISAELKIGLIQSAFEDAVSSLASGVGKDFNQVVGELQQSIAANDPARVLDAFNHLRSVAEDLGAANSILDRLDSGVKSLSGTIYSRIDTVDQELNHNVDEIKAQLQNQQWQLEQSAQVAIFSKIDVARGACSKFLEQARSIVSAQLYDAPNKIPGALAKSIVVLLSPYATRFQQTLVAIRSLIQDVVAQLGFPTEVHLSYHFAPRVQDAPSGQPIFKARYGGNSASLAVDASVVKHFDGRTPESSVKAQLSNFELHLFPFAPFLEIAFNGIEFEAKNGSAPSVKVQVAESRFVGPLDFVKKLQALLKGLSGDSASGPYLTVQPTQLQAGFRFAIPSIATGAFTLTNLTFHTAIRLPFLGEPTRLIFSFSDRAKPCILSYAIFGGTAFIGLEATARGVEQIEGALEFGAVTQLNLTVAHGAVRIVGGFYFRQRSDSMLLCGYVRAVGELNILGLISMTVQFFLGLSYEHRSDATYLVGECTVTVEIGFTFFSVSARLSLRKEFAGDKHESNQSSTSQASLVASIMPNISEIGDFLVGQDISENWRAPYLEHLLTYAW